MAPNAPVARGDTVPAMTTSREELVAELRALIDAAADKNALEALPKKLSPSRASDFMKCPQQFYYKTIAGIPTPQNPATLRGSVSHAALERIFDHPAGERTEELALSYVRPEWEKIINPDVSKMTGNSAKYALSAQKNALEIITPGTQDETDMLAAASECVSNWFKLEKVNNFSPTELELPSGRVVDGRELYVMGKLAGITAHGFIDRLDRWFTPGRPTPHWSITDYKSAKIAPWMKKAYPPHTADRIKYETFFQLRSYAVFMWKMHGVQVERLRLVYIGTDDREVGVQELLVTQKMIDDTIRELEDTWQDIKRAARTGVWETKKSVLCDWCHFKVVCPSFAAPATGENETARA